MTDLSEIEAIIRGVAIGGFAASGLVLVATPRPSPTRWLGAAFFLGVIAHVISAWGPELKRFDPVWAASVIGAGLFWMFALDLLEDRPRPPLWRFAAPAAAFLFWLAAQVAPKAWCETIWGGYIAMQMMMVTHILVVAWRGWRGDLVAQRRRLRPILAVSACVYVLEVAARDMGWLNALPPASVDVAQAALLAVLALGTTLALLRAEPQLVAQSETPARLASPRPLDLTPADRLILARLDKAMDKTEVWRGEDLSIGSLAALVGAPEHRLRKLINGVLGHRNFADYVNGRRIEAAKVALADPEQALKSVSTIAYELGPLLASPRQSGANRRRRRSPICGWSKPLKPRRKPTNAPDFAGGEINRKTNASLAGFIAKEPPRCSILLSPSPATGWAACRSTWPAT